MRPILIGCEYAGTTTLGNAISAWTDRTMGFKMGLHDHWKIPNTIGHPSDMTEEEQAQYMALSPRIKEWVQRHNLHYHTPHAPGDDILHSGYYFEDTIYGDLYFDYPPEGRSDRGWHRKKLEHKIMETAPETVVILVKASPEVIRARMRETPHQPSVVQDKDVETVLQLFEDAYEATLLNKFTLDTSAATVDETIAQFEKLIEPHLTQNDRLRMLTQRQRK